MLKKLITAVVVPFILFLGIAAGNIETWSYPNLWVIFGIVVTACLLQPAYKPIDSTAPERDKGTATQIVWSVYTALIISVVEAVYFRFPQSFALDVYAVAGLVLAISGLALRSWAFLVLGRHFTWHITVYDDHKVIADGPYRLIRHPGYAGAWLLYSAIPLMLHAWVGLIISIAVQFLAYSRRIKHEEAELRGKLGDAYSSYEKGTKTLIPYVY